MSALSVAPSLASLEMKLAQARSRYDSGAGQRALLRKQWADTASRHTEVVANILRWQKTQVLLTKVAAFARKQLDERVKAGVTAALRSIVDDKPGIAFNIVYDEIGRKQTADWEVASQYGKIGLISNSPEDDRGGGIADVVSFALRLIILECANPRCEGIVALDEPGKMVSIQYVRNLGIFLRTYARQTGRQVLMITHNPLLAAVGDVAYWTTQEEGMSHIRRTTPGELQELLAEAAEKARAQAEAANNQGAALGSPAAEEATAQ